MEVTEILIVLQGIRPEADFRASHDYLADGLLDSFDVVVLVTELEARTGMVIPGERIVPKNFHSAEAIGALLLDLEVGP